MTASATTNSMHHRVGNVGSAGFGIGGDTTDRGGIAIASTGDATQTERCGPNLQYAFALSDGTYRANLRAAEVDRATATLGARDELFPGRTP
jgi:hypothetical protein